LNRLIPPLESSHPAVRIPSPTRWNSTSSRMNAVFISFFYFPTAIFPFSHRSRGTFPPLTEYISTAYIVYFHHPWSVFPPLVDPSLRPDCTIPTIQSPRSYARLTRPHGSLTHFLRVNEYLPTGKIGPKTGQLHHSFDTVAKRFSSRRCAPINVLNTLLPLFPIPKPLREGRNQNTGIDFISEITSLSKKKIERLK